MKSKLQLHCLKLSLSVFIGMLLSCSNSKSTEGLLTIEIPDTIDPQLSLTDISSSIQVIQLETNDKSLLNFIQDVKQNDGKLYVVDLAGRILVFDIQGRFLYQLGKQGNGPGEYSYVSSFSVDEASEQFFIAAGRKLMVYSGENTLIAEEVLPEFIDYVQVLPGSRLYLLLQLYGVQNEGGLANQTTLFEMDSELSIKDSIPFRVAYVDEQVAATYPYKHFMSNVGNQTYLYSPVLTNEKFLRDTLYIFRDNLLTPFAKFYFQGPHLTDKGDKAIWIKNAIVSSAYMICEYDDSGNGQMMFLYDQKNTIGYNLKGGLLDSEGDTVFLRPLDLTNDTFYYIKTAKYLDGSSEELNPLIGIVTLR